MARAPPVNNNPDPAGGGYGVHVVFLSRSSSLSWLGVTRCGSVWVTRVATRLGLEEPGVTQYG